MWYLKNKAIMRRPTKKNTQKNDQKPGPEKNSKFAVLVQLAQ